MLLLVYSVAIEQKPIFGDKVLHSKMNLGLLTYHLTSEPRVRFPGLAFLKQLLKKRECDSVGKTDFINTPFRGTVVPLLVPVRYLGQTRADSCGPHWL